MDFSIWFVLVGVAGIAVAGLWWKRRARPVYVIDHVRVEMHPACVVEDRVIEVVWRAAISMTNTSRRPRALPVFAERATVTAGRRVYLATVNLDAELIEINPDDLALAWIEFVLHSGELPRVIDVTILNRSHSMSLRFAQVRDGLSGPAKDPLEPDIQAPPRTPHQGDPRSK